MASITAMQVANNPVYQDRVAFYMKKSAIAVMAEDPQTENHAERVAYAKTVLPGEASVTAYAIGTMTNSTLESAANPDAPDQGITDPNLEFAVNSMYNAYAGVAT